jgi:SAM-dependent methyltransferase
LNSARSLLWCASAFCSAFLSFVVQPLLAKWLLPSFGGSPSTWGACLVFFQVMLLGGYGYARLCSRLPGVLARGLHVLLCLVVLAFCGLARLPAPEAFGALPPALRILWLLGCSAGLPYLLTSSTAPLLSDWAAQLNAAVPHRLYAISNLGSLLALLAYPAWIEAAWPIDEQYAWFLRVACVASVLSLGCLALGARGATRTHAAPVAAAVSWRQRALWLCCALVPSFLLVAVTNHLSVDLAPTPLLWVVPLALYLLSFIAAFAGWVARWRAPLMAAWVAASSLLGYGAFAQGSARLSLQLVAALGSLACAGLLAHDSLVRARPEPRQLTSFYVWIAVGGALGGVCVTFIAPAVFSDYYELELGCALAYALLWYAGRTHERGALRASAERRWLLLGAALVLPLMAAACLLRAADVGARSVRVLERRRSFLGALKVSEDRVARMLTHGRIRHGMQLLDPALAGRPTMYFGPGTAVSQVLSQHRAGSPRRLGIVGLGVGTLAAYGKAGDALSFFELDPLVVDLARRRFDFLRATPAKVELRVGDGRLLLARLPPQGFDVLVLDAFASDAVPVHLLTAEAFSEYLRHLAPEGVLLANVSNRHLAVDRVVRAAAKMHGLACVITETEADATRYVSKVRWAVLARDPAQLARETAGQKPLRAGGSPVLWTDARASVWSIVK